MHKRPATVYIILKILFEVFLMNEQRMLQKVVRIILYSSISWHVHP